MFKIYDCLRRQIVVFFFFNYLGDNLHEMSKTVFLEN